MAVVSGVLTVNADNIGENIHVDPGAVIINATHYVVSDSFQSILVNGNGGNDTITIASVFTIPTTLNGGAGNDSFVGGRGNDHIDGGNGADTMRGGDGKDTADYSSRTAPVTVGIGTLNDDGEPGEKDNVWNDIEAIAGGSGNDTLRGDGQANTLIGNGGNDSLRGGTGNDYLDGGSGTDTLNGEGGVDTGVNGETFLSIESSGGGSAVITADRTLLVTGTSSPDSVGIGMHLEDNDNFIVISINGSDKEFKRADFDRVVINSLGGDDEVSLGGFFFDLEQPITINGGDGNDHVDLDGGSVSATFNGGAGNDSVKAEDTFVQKFDGGSGVDSAEFDNQASPGTFDMNVRAPNVENFSLNNGTLIGNVLNNTLSIGPGTILGGDGNDTLRTGAGGLLNGEGGNDTLISGAFGTVTLLGSAGNDTLLGGGSDDYLDGGTGGDLMKGGGGSDTLDYSSRTAAISAGPGTQADDGEAGEGDNIATDIETILGSSGSDSIKGTGAANLLVGNDGNDTLLGFGGNDTLVGGEGNDFLDGGDGIDELQGNSGENVLLNGETGDTLPYSITPDRTLLVTGTEASDSVLVRGGVNPGDQYGIVHITVNNGPEVGFDVTRFDRIEVRGLGANDHITFQNLNDSKPCRADGGSGNDSIIGSDENDEFAGGSGNDSLDGGGGDDTLDGGTGADAIKGGGGNDTADYSLRTAALTIGIGTVADDGEAGEGDNVYLDIETVLGGSGNDNIRGRELNNLLVGNGGNDTLFGHYGNDTLMGGEGNDDLDGGPDADTLNGGNGTDKGKQSAADTLISIEQPYA